MTAALRMQRFELVILSVDPSHVDLGAVSFSRLPIPGEEQSSPRWGRIGIRRARRQLDIDGTILIAHS